MLNRYSKLPKISIQNTQALPDLGVYEKALARKQLSYDTTAAAVSKFQNDQSQIQGFGEKDNAYLQAINSDIQNKVASVANKDLGSPEVKNDLNGYVQSIATNPEIQKIKKVKELKDTYDASASDLDSKGKLHANQKLLHDMAWNNYSKTGQITPEMQQPLYEAQDLVKGRGDLVNMLKANGTDVIQALSDGTAYKNSSKGVASDRIKKAVEAQLPTYMNSAYGRQEHTDWKAGQLTGAVPKGMSFGDYLTKQVMSTAANYAYSDFSTNKDVALNASKKDKDEKKKEEETLMSNSEEFNLSPVSADQEYNSDGSRRSKTALFSFTGDKGLTDDEKKDPSYQRAALGAKALGMTQKDYDSHFRQNSSIPVMNYVKETKRKDLTSLLTTGNSGLINSAAIIDKDNKKSTLKDILASQGVKGNKAITEYLKDNIQVTGKVVPNGGAADGYRISMDGQDYILDLTSALENRIQSGQASKEDIAKYQAYENEQVKSGAAKVVKAKEGTFIQVWNPISNQMEFKPTK